MLKKGLLVILIQTQMMGCATLFSSLPKPLTDQQRLELFPQPGQWPVSSAVDIFLNENMIPWIFAKTDEDCAFALGVVQAYLRLGQMEIFRRASAGRLSEFAGPYAAPALDKMIRTIDFGRSAHDSLALLTEADAKWLDRFVEGINFFIDHSQKLPYEFEFLDLTPEHWTKEDVFRISRLAGSDANWLLLLSLPALLGKEGFSEYWRKVTAGQTESLPSIKNPQTSGLEQLMGFISRTGSNSVVIGRSKSKSNGALIASDPHLGIFAPNLWLLAGYQSPSYHVVGYMLPGVPAVTIGRNENVGWGGTYMRAISSHLVRSVIQLKSKRQIEGR